MVNWMPVDIEELEFIDVECMNCTMPIGAVEINEPYPEVICQMCDSYTTVEEIKQQDWYRSLYEYDSDC